MDVRVRLQIKLSAEELMPLNCVDHHKPWKILRDGNTRPPYLPPEKSACRSRNNS